MAEAKKDPRRKRATPRGKKAYTYLDLAEMHAGKRSMPPLMTMEDARLYGDLTEYSQRYIRKQLEKSWESRRSRQYPFERIHREMRRAGLLHCEVGIDPPNWVNVWEYVEQPRTHKDKYGRVLYMTKGKKEMKRLRPEDFAPLPQFEPIYPIHPNPAAATDAEKEERIAAFLNAYSVSALRTVSAQYVGVNYFQIILWINEKEEWQSKLIVAEEAAKLVMVDIGRQRAIMGDSSLLRFFIERDNPERYGRMARKREAHELPEGVTSDSVASALAMIAKAQGEGEGIGKALTAPTDSVEVLPPDGIPAALVNQTAPPASAFLPPRAPMMVTLGDDD